MHPLPQGITFRDDRVVLFGRVAHVDFDLDQENNFQKVRIATQETRDSMEKMLENLMSGHRREYCYSPENNYYNLYHKIGNCSGL